MTFKKYIVLRLIRLSLQKFVIYLKCVKFSQPMIIVSEAKMSHLFAVLRDVLWAQRGDAQTGMLFHLD